ncbi:MAG: hypothetical protein ACOH2T_28845 [Pseudomonas sp.]
MKPSYMRHLADIAEKRGLSPSVNLVITRRICREFTEGLSAIHDERRALRRKATKLKVFLPFTKLAVADMERLASECQSESLAHLRNSLASIGYELLLDCNGMANALGFDRLCDVLNINTVEREQARREGITSLNDLAFVHALEDSAERRKQEWNDAPLFNACQRAMARFIKECPKDQLPDPFAPGMPFGPKLPPDLRIVGK